MRAVFNKTLNGLVQLQPIDKRPVAPSRFPGWLRESFGHGTDQHTTIAPQKTDACAECCVLTNRKESLLLSLNRHKQQLGEQTMHRMQCITELEGERREVLEEQKTQRKTAATA